MTRELIILQDETSISQISYHVIGVGAEVSLKLAIRKDLPFKVVGASFEDVAK